MRSYYWYNNIEPHCIKFADGRIRKVVAKTRRKSSYELSLYCSFYSRQTRKTCDIYNHRSFLHVHLCHQFFDIVPIWRFLFSRPRVQRSATKFQQQVSTFYRSFSRRRWRVHVKYYFVQWQNMFTSSPTTICGTSFPRISRSDYSSGAECTVSSVPCGNLQFHTLLGTTVI